MHCRQKPVSDGYLRAYVQEELSCNRCAGGDYLVAWNGCEVGDIRKEI